MKASDLTNPGPNLQGLRRDLARAVSEANANRKQYASDLKSMLDAAIGTDSRDFELPNPGPDWQNLRVSVSKAIRESFVNKVFYQNALMAMLGQAADAIDSEDAGIPPYMDNVGQLFRQSALSLSDVSTSGNDALIINHPDYPWTLTETSGTPPITYSYQWFREDSPLSGSEENIPGATSNIYNPTVDDLGKHVGFTITATNEYGEDSLVIANSRKVIDASLAPNAVDSATFSDRENSGEVDFTITPGAQVQDHPDTEYSLQFESQLGSEYNEYRTVLQSSGYVFDIPPGTYDIYIGGVSNDVTTRFMYQQLVSDFVVT